jgi:steroid delta-isomerase-like uncharacterized protein
MSDQTATASERLNPESARELFERNYELLNKHDTRLIPTCFTEDVEFHDDAWPETIKGHTEMERFLTAVWRAAPDFRFEVLEGPYLAEDGRSAAVRVRASGTMTGPFDPPGFAPTNTRMATEFAGFYEFEQGRIKRARIIVNMNNVGIQMGAAPAPGSRGERLAVAMQRLNARRRRRRTKG